MNIFPQTIRKGWDFHTLEEKVKTSNFPEAFQIPDLAAPVWFSYHLRLKGTLYLSLLGVLSKCFFLFSMQLYAHSLVHSCGGRTHWCTHLLGYTQSMVNNRHTMWIVKWKWMVLSPITQLACVEARMGFHMRQLNLGKWAPGEKGMDRQ